jgi:hypothetical protein
MLANALPLWTPNPLGLPSTVAAYSVPVEEGGVSSQASPLNDPEYGAPGAVIVILELEPLNAALPGR